jgi:hypothetical protein
MQSGSPLRSQIQTAWRQTINNEYDERLINSERGLQVYFCKRLMDQFQEAGMDRRLFIEPRINFSANDSSRYPDIVICNTRSIIGVVEIKYQPRARPDYEKDLETLNLLLQHGSAITLSNDRYRGEIEVHRSFSLATDAVLCWAGVYASPEQSIQHQKGLAINHHVMALHALTRVGSMAQVVTPFDPAV